MADKDEQEKKAKVILIKKKDTPDVTTESSSGGEETKKKRVVVVKKKTPVVAKKASEQESVEDAPVKKKSTPATSEPEVKVEPKKSSPETSVEVAPKQEIVKEEPAPKKEAKKTPVPSEEASAEVAPKKTVSSPEPEPVKESPKAAPAQPEVEKEKEDVQKPESSREPVVKSQKKTVIKKPLGMVDRSGLDPSRAPGRIVNKPFVQQHLQNAQRSMQRRPAGGAPRGQQGGPRPGGGRPGGYQGKPGGYQGRPGGSPGGYNQRPGGGGQRPGGFRKSNDNDAPAPPFVENKGSSRHGKAKNKQVYTKKNKYQENLDKINLSKKTVVMQNPVPKEIDILENITISDLAKKMNLKSSEIMQKLMSMGEPVSNMNQQIDAETATLVADEYSCKVKIVSLYDETVIESHTVENEDLLERAPIVTVMGHVDHGKTKLLDAIRSSDVVAGEFGGITQHIGAYKIHHGEKELVFLDTPGHAAFTMMRSRGAQVTDIVVLVVAANDGVMPQTIEAIHHAKEAEVPIIVAINKIDLPEANTDRIKQQLSEHDLLPEDWGGSTMFCEISALKRLGIDELLEAILLQTEVMELTSNFTCRAEGKVLESRMDQGRGNVADIIIQRGTLQVGDPFVAGVFSGKVRAIFDDRGNKITTAGPSTPVEVTGLTGLPGAGTPFQVTENEKIARQIGLKRQELERYSSAQRAKVSLDNLFDTIKEGSIQVLKVIIKSDVAGSSEALKMALEELSTDEIKLTVIHASPGPIVENDVNLASASDAILIGFNVRPTPQAQQLAEREKVEIRKYNVIYDAVDEMKLAMEGMLEPDYKEEQIGTVEIRETFKVPKIGVIAGCYVTDGMVKRNSTVRVIREGIEIHCGKISSLKRMKDDAKSVVQDFECGIGIENYQDIAPGDILEVVELVEIKKTL